MVQRKLEEKRLRGLSPKRWIDQVKEFTVKKTLEIPQTGINTERLPKLQLKWQQYQITTLQYTTREAGEIV